MAVTVDDLVATTAWDLRDRELVSLGELDAKAPLMLFRPTQDELEWAAEFRRFVDLATGANLRVRVAQLWLDAH